MSSFAKNLKARSVGGALAFSLAMISAPALAVELDFYNEGSSLIPPPVSFGPGEYSGAFCSCSADGATTGSDANFGTDGSDDPEDFWDTISFEVTGQGTGGFLFSNTDRITFTSIEINGIDFMLNGDNWTGGGLLAPGKYLINLQGTTTATPEFSDLYTGVYQLDLAAVPEPATWAMMVLGFGLVGAGMRSRKPSVAFA